MLCDRRRRPFTRSIWKCYVTLFWSLFGLTQLNSVREGDVQLFTKRVGEYMLMCYHAMAVIVLVNMLIAMMSNSFQEIEVHLYKSDLVSRAAVQYCFRLVCVYRMMYDLCMCVCACMLNHNFKNIFCRRKNLKKKKRLRKKLVFYSFAVKVRIALFFFCQCCVQRRTEHYYRIVCRQACRPSIISIFFEIVVENYYSFKPLYTNRDRNDFFLYFNRLGTSFTTLFWTLFALISLVVLEIELRFIEGFGKLLFGLYHIAGRILFLNMLIAMMSKSYNITVVR